MVLSVPAVMFVIGEISRKQRRVSPALDSGQEPVVTCRADR